MYFYILCNNLCLHIQNVSVRTCITHVSTRFSNHSVNPSIAACLLNNARNSLKSVTDKIHIRKYQQTCDIKINPSEPSFHGVISDFHNLVLINSVLWKHRHTQLCSVIHYVLIKSYIVAMATLPWEMVPNVDRVAHSSVSHNKISHHISSTKVTEIPGLNLYIKIKSKKKH